MQIVCVCVILNARRDGIAKQQSLVHRTITQFDMEPMAYIQSIFVHLVYLSLFHSRTLSSSRYAKWAFERYTNSRGWTAVFHWCGFASFLVGSVVSDKLSKRRQSAKQTVTNKTKSFRHFSYKTNCEMCDDTRRPPPGPWRPGARRTAEASLLHNGNIFGRPEKGLILIYFDMDMQITSSRQTINVSLCSILPDW